MKWPTGVAKPRRLRDVHPTRRGLILAWFAFAVTFGVLRAITWSIHAHVGHFANVTAGSVHLHHYLWGILLIAIVAFLGLVERSPTWRTAMGLAFGIGLALIVDELALLIDLKDVYWSGAGGVSVAVALVLIAVAGGLLALTRAPGRHDDLSTKAKAQPTTRTAPE
jgi:hypothetical protein